MWALLPFIGFALGENHYAIDCSQFEKSKRNTFETHQTGWIIQNAPDFQRIYMGDSNEDVLLWKEYLAKQMHITLEPVEISDFNCTTIWSFNDIFICQIDDIGLYAQGPNATDLLQNLLNQLKEYPSTIPNPPTIHPLPNDTIKVILPANMGFSFEGGTPIYGNALTFKTPPTAIVLWNQYAQSHKWYWNNHEYELDKSPRHSEIIPMNRH